jgi:hypothetical protein
MSGNTGWAKFRDYLVGKFLADPTPEAWEIDGRPVRLALVRFEDVRGWLAEHGFDLLATLEAARQRKWIEDLRVGRSRLVGVRAEVCDVANTDSPTPKPNATGADVADTVRKLALLLGDGGDKLIGIIHDQTMTVDQKLRALDRLDQQRFRGFKSADLAELLSVSPPAVRNSSCWREWHPRRADE